LNLAFHDGLVATNPWHRVKGFKAVDAARLRYFTVNEARRLINAADPDFRSLLEAALVSGARYGELTLRLTVQDFNINSGTIGILISKSKKVRHIVLTAEGIGLFTRLTAGRAGHELILRRGDGSAWAKGSQTSPMRETCLRARIDPPAGFHTLRHTWASLAIQSGCPLMVVARNLGHADTKMVEKHYGHLSKSYVANSIREFAPVFGFAADEKIRPLR
jgi:integrase